MNTKTVEELYQRHVMPLQLREQLQLVEMIVQKMLLAKESTPPPKKRSIMELHGLGAEIWEGVDAQEYVNELRKEWDHRP